jgi:hypothetical protein
MIAMKDDFHLVDLISQASAVQRLLNGKSVMEKIAWLSAHGKLSQREKKTTEWPDIYDFETKTGMECILILQGNVFRIFLGDHHFSNVEI